MTHCGQFRKAPFTRREFLNQTGVGFGSIALSGLMNQQTEAAERHPFAPANPHFDPKVNSVIFLYMDGGVSQVDSFDPKPALKKYEGKAFPSKIEPTQFNNIGGTLPSPWKFKNYGECGLPVSDLFPFMGQHADSLAVIRSMTSNFSEHTNANYFLHTGHGQQGRPSMGAWVGYGLGTECQELPAFVILNGGLIPPGGLDNFNSGFLPASYQGSVFANSDPPVSNIKPQEKKCSLAKQQT